MDTKQVYDSNSSKWLRLEPSSLSDFTARPFVFDACGAKLDGKSVLDIGCGEGYCARELKRRGAGHITGVDLSENMIAAARERDAIDRYGIEYQSANIVEFVPDRRFDLCIAVFLFNYLNVESMHRVMAMVYNALHDDGEFIFSIPHPFFPFVRSEKKPPFYFDSEGKNYFTDVDEQFEGEIWKQDGVPLHVQCVHKTLGDYFTGLKNAGFSSMPELTELTVTDQLAQKNPEFFGPLINTPLHILFRVKR